MAFPAPHAPVPATPIPEVEAAIDRLHAKKAAWPSVSIADRIHLLERCIKDTLAVSEEWVAAGARLKGFAPTDNLAGEEWLAGPMATIRNARLFIDALRAGGAPKAIVRTRTDGQTVARVFPANMKERVMFAGTTVDVWIAKGERPSQGAIYRDGGKTKKKEGGVCLVLGGGNVSSIPPMDVLYKLFVDDEVCLLKMNPVNEALGAVLEKAFAALVSGGWLAIVYGGAEVGAHAANHSKIDSLHVTGSDRTYDAIVWGGAEKKKQTGAKRVNEKPFTAELGCVTPVIVVPGPWSASDIRYHARNVASMVTQNASFNCNAAKVVVTAREWLQRDAFLDALHDELRRTPARKAYYPGARDRHKRFIDAYPTAKVLGEVPADAAAEVVPWTAIPDVPSDAGGYALTNEAFCGVVAEVTLDAEKHGHVDVPLFLERAVSFANERCWGTLSCSMLVHPATEEEHDADVKQAIADLRYGGIAINAFPGLIYALGSATWGAFPGHRPEDIQSGIGVVHNGFMFDHPQKSVVRAPFRIRPTPAWFSDHKNLRELGKELTHFEANPTWGGVFRVARAAMKG
jgi:acyl-CoA reductase-like NAD-dependent aldehyde dehydrogenase